MRILVTGANGFIGRNLCVKLAERPGVEIVRVTRETNEQQLQSDVAGADFIFHLAGINRPQDPDEFQRGNLDFTAKLAGLIAKSGRRTPIVFTSSIQAERENDYGRSKLMAENVLRDLAEQEKLPLHLFRLPNVFGKWCRPDYNSVVATYCHNIARELPIRLDDPAAVLNLVYIDDVLDSFLALLDGAEYSGTERHIDLVYQISLGDLAEKLKSFADGREKISVGKVGVGLDRALYATYVSYLPAENFSHVVTRHADPRGVFVEMLKTPESGQFSYFTAHPGITRGGHYHHTKTEKFLVIKGQAKFGFRHILSNEYRVLFTSGEAPEIVDTVPGWTHDITNVGTDEMIVMLWANEVFDRDRPDTYARPVEHE